MRLAFGCDHAGFPHKSVMIESLEADGHVVLDLGTFSEDPVDYPDFARVVANAVRNKFVDFGVLLCGSGVGASIAANKVRGIRAALVHDEFTAMQSRADDDANVVCLGARVLDADTAASLALKFLATSFSNEPRHVRRVAKIAELETGLPKGAERVVRPASSGEGAAAARGAHARPGTNTIPEAPVASPPPAQPVAPVPAPAPPPATPPPVAAPPAAPAAPPQPPAPAAPSAAAETVIAPVPAAQVVAPAPTVAAPTPRAPVAAARETVSVVEAPPPAPRSETRGRVEPAPDLQAALQEAAAAVGAREPPEGASPAPPELEPVAVQSRQSVDVVESAEVQTALKKLEDMEFVGRLWIKDSTLWSDDPDVQASIRNRLGWLTSPTLMREYAADVKAFATEVRRLGFSNIVLLGIGGSSLAPEVMNLTFGSKMGFPDFAVLDSTDPAAVKNMLARLQLPRTLFVVSSKSGTTTEVLALYRFFRAQVEAGKPPKPGQNFVAITDPGSPLEKLAREGGFRRTFLNHPSIGGRFSALSFFGLVPAALIGVDIDRLLERAAEMSAACGDAVQERQNPGIVLGAVLGGFARAGRNKVTFALSPTIRSFGSWLEQMIGESTGKDGKGLVPVDAERLGAPEVYGQDRVFISIALASEAPDPALDTLEAAGHPVYRLTLKDPYDIGAEFFRWELGTAVAAALIGVNPFDEPNVAQAKDATLSMLATFRKLKRLPDWPVDREEDGILLLTNQGMKPATLSAGVGAFLAQAKPGDYVAILAYLTPEHETTDALQTLATVIRDQLKVATTVDYGPRYLHSLGQLHKGGAPNLLAIQLTCDDKDDVPIPGEGYGFSALKAAQALGDLETLRKANRRVIRLHLGGRAQTAIEKLTAMVRRTVQ